MNNLKAKETYFPQLDIIRFIAAFMIIILHSYEGWCSNFGEIPFFSTGSPGGVNTIGACTESLIETFRIGVDIFFLLSGFLITYLLLKEKEKNNKINIRNFFTRRVLRIWPLYYLLIILAPFIVHWLNVSPPDYLPNILFINNFHTIKTQQWTFPFEHFWSICIEEHFYLVWPFIIAFTSKKKLPYIFYSILFLSISYRLWVIYTNANPVLVLYLNTLCRIDVIVIGALVAYYYCKKPFVIKVPGIIRLLIYIILAVSLIANPGFKEPLFELLKRYFYIGLIGFAILNYNFNPNARLQLKRNRFIHYLGKISYGIYMYGNIVMVIIIKKLLIPNHLVNIYIYIGLVTIIPIIISSLSYEFFETPFLKLKKRFEVIRNKY